MGLLNKKNIKNLKIGNKYNITEKDLIGDLKDFPLGVVIRMLEEQELQGNKPDVTVFQKDSSADFTDRGFSWDDTDDEYHFWRHIINKKFDIFYERYPEYKKYDE